jgi:hypothetical protein
MMRNKWLMFGCFLPLSCTCALLLLFPGRHLLRLVYDYHRRSQWVEKTFGEIAHYPNSTLLFADKREYKGTPSCATVSRIGFFGTDDSFPNIKEYYEHLFTNFGWNENLNSNLVADGKWSSFNIDSYARARVAEIDTLPAGVSMSPDKFATLRRGFGTVYSVEVLSLSSIACPFLGDSDN